jgi:hypothetical protein|tara:strand:+ start:167 stop:472 length:306 start_codon:yes stop_codon:yes gene_type:complete
MENFSEFFNSSFRREDDQNQFFDEELVRVANDNTFDILMGKITMMELIDKNIETPLLVDPTEKIISDSVKLEILDGMIEHYVELEEYEKCAKLVKIKEKLC